jgi:hypothetical protein
MACASSLDLFGRAEHIPPGYRLVGLASETVSKIQCMAKSKYDALVGAGFMPAHLGLIRPRAGMKPAPTRHNATILARLRVLRQFPCCALTVIPAKAGIQSSVLCGTLGLGGEAYRAWPTLPRQLLDIAQLWHIPTVARLIRSSERFLQGRFSLQRVKNHYTSRLLN